MLFSKLIRQEEKTIDGQQYVVKYLQPGMFHYCTHNYRVELYKIVFGKKHLILMTSCDYYMIPVEKWVGDHNKIRKARFERTQLDTIYL